jgi:hypothetical protein
LETLIVYPIRAPAQYTRDVRILHLFRKPGRDQPLEPAESLTLLAGYGIEGDANAAKDSARQILLAGMPAVAALGIAPGDLRENILLEDAVEGLASGTVLRIGQALLRITLPCEPCWKLNRVRPSLAGAALGRRGVLARVLAG